MARIRRPRWRSGGPPPLRTTRGPRRRRRISSGSKPNALTWRAVYPEAVVYLPPATFATAHTRAVRALRPRSATLQQEPHVEGVAAAAHPTGDLRPDL